MIKENYKWEKSGFIYKPQNECDWWKTHAMAPAPILLNKNTIRIYIGAWDSNNISRITYIDVDSKKPNIVKKISKKMILDIGQDGCFDDNGVFPGHAYKCPDGKIYLYYTGFQKLDKIPFSNFSGLAISNDNGENFERVSQAPVMDRADEGLYTRAGLSTIYDEGIFKCCYSVGSGWYKIAGKERPIYDINYIETKDGISFANKGQKIIEVDLNKEHGLGRPQIIKLKKQIFCFYTRRTLDFKYFIGVAQLVDNKWERIDDWFNDIKHGEKGAFDEQMIYFPAVIDTGEDIFLFYTGNGYGKDGIGYLKLIHR